jgi:hypothetical protein
MDEVRKRIDRHVHELPWEAMEDLASAVMKAYVELMLGGFFAPRFPVITIELCLHSFRASTVFQLRDRYVKQLDDITKRLERTAKALHAESKRALVLRTLSTLLYKSGGRELLSTMSLALDQCVGMGVVATAREILVMVFAMLICRSPQI